MFSAAALILTVLLAPMAPVQIRPAADPRVEVVLEGVSALPGKELTIPVTVKLLQPADVRSLEFKLQVPDHTTFSSVEPSFLLKDAKGSAHATRDTVAQRSVTIAITSAAQPIPEGVIGYLVLHVAGDAKPHSLDVVARDLVVKSTNGADVAPSRLKVGEMSLIDARDAVMPACFFYMH